MDANTAASITCQSALQVIVTAHPASSVADDGRAYVGSEQWRVLRFNTVTRQSVNRVHVRHNGAGHEAVEARPECLAFPYLRAMASSGTSDSAWDACTGQQAFVRGSNSHQPSHNYA